MSTAEPPSFDELLDLLRVRLGIADDVNATESHSFKELMADHKDEIADQWYHRAFDELQAQGHLAVIPGPGSFKEFLALLLTATTEETVRSEPHTEEIVDYGIYGRRDENGADLGGAMYETRVVGTRTVDTRRRLDERDILFRAIPDLRSAVRTPKG